MEALIDLNYLIKISFGNSVILLDLIESWKVDSIQTMSQLKNIYSISWKNETFKLMHQMKSNFQMIGCSTGIQLCQNSIDVKQLPNWETLNCLVDDVLIALDRTKPIKSSNESST